MKFYLAIASMLLATSAFADSAYYDDPLPSAISALDLSAETSVPNYSPTAGFTRPAPHTPQAHNWSGLYVGFNGGFANGRFDTDAQFTNPGGSVSGEELPNHVTGFLGGGQVGYNWHLEELVAGVEVDFQGGSVKDTIDVGS